MFVPTGDRRTKRRNAPIGLGIAALLLSGGVALAVFGDHSAPASQAKVGDCMHNRGNKVDPDLVVTDCGPSG